MRIFLNETLEVAQDDVKVINFNNGRLGDEPVPELYIESDADIGIVVRSFTNADSEGVELSAVKIDTLEKVAEVTEAGIYMYLVGSAEKVQITFGGEANIILKACY